MKYKHKPIYRYDIEQNTDEWFDIKKGKFSASTCAELLMDKTTKGYTNLISKIVEEKITGEQCENIKFFGNYYTNRGHEFEPIAREDYEIRTLQIVKQVGVVELDETDDWCLCSPDGLINDNAILQIKCPVFNTQIDYLTMLSNGKDPVKPEYLKQIQFELFVTKRDYCILTMFHPKLKSIDIIVERDENMIDKIFTRLNEAKQESKIKIERILNL